jgi:hypothetical protein
MVDRENRMKPNNKKLSRTPPPKKLNRQKKLLAKSARSADSRRKNLLSNMANARIKGHAKGAHRRAQAKRDAKQRGR